jgi:hypothetical protein
VQVAATGDVRVFGGISDALAHVVDDNAAKLGECRPRETHLAVGVVRFGAARDPDQSTVPALPSTVDHLWVIQLWQGLGERVPIWHALRGSNRWTMHEPPA